VQNTPKPLVIRMFQAAFPHRFSRLFTMFVILPIITMSP